MTTVYPGAHTDRIEKIERAVAELERTIGDVYRLTRDTAEEERELRAAMERTTANIRTEMLSAVAEQDRRIRDLEYALLSAAGQALVGASLCDSTAIDSANLLRGLAPHVETSTSAADTGQAATISQGTAAAAPTVHPLPVATSSEPLMAEERYSASLGIEMPEDVNDEVRTVEFRPGDRCAVYTGGDPCVKPGTVEAQEHDGRWLISIDRAGKIRATEEEMVFLPESWR